MDDKQAKQDQLFQLAAEIEVVKANLKDKQSQLEHVLLDLGIDTYHQDPISGVVYKVYVPDGTYCHFSKIAVKRTALPGEKGGTVLAKSEAESMGFVLRK